MVLIRRGGAVRGQVGAVLQRRWKGLPVRHDPMNGAERGGLVGQKGASGQQQFGRPKTTEVRRSLLAFQVPPEQRSA